MGHISVGHRWDRVAMDILDMSITTPIGNRYVIVMVDCLLMIRSVATRVRPFGDKISSMTSGLLNVCLLSGTGL